MRLLTALAANVGLLAIVRPHNDGATRLLILLAACLGLLSSVRAQNASADFPQAGFSIEPPDSKPGTRPMEMVAAFMLPAEGNFASNVNVMTFANHASIKSFIETSRKETTAMKMKIIAEQQPTPDSWVVEYTGTQGQRELHFYMRAIWKDGRVIGATATAMQAEWPKVAEQLKASVDSLKLK